MFWIPLVIIAISLLEWRANFCTMWLPMIGGSSCLHFNICLSIYWIGLTPPFGLYFPYSKRSRILSWMNEFQYFSMNFSLNSVKSWTSFFTIHYQTMASSTKCLPIHLISSLAWNNSLISQFFQKFHRIIVRAIKCYSFITLDIFHAIVLSRLYLIYPPLHHLLIFF